MLPGETTAEFRGRPGGTFPWTALAWVMLAASAVLVPFFFLGNASGHDFEFHVASWMDVARQWRAGVWYPRWAAEANYGFGDPRFIFYPPASWLLGAALGLVLPWKMAPGALVWLALVGAGSAMLRLAREWLPPRQATLAAVLYAVNPYHLAVIYYRSAYAELLASAVFPLLILYAVRLGRNGARAVGPLALVFAAIWLANAPAGVIAAYCLALLLAIQGANRSPRLLARGAAAMALGLLLAAFYILPAAYEQRWVDIAQALSSGLRPEQNSLFTSIGDPEHNLFNLKMSALAAAEIVVAAAASLFFPRQTRPAREAWSILAVLGLAAVVLMLPASAPAWRYLPELRFVQFPWRWLFPLNLAFSIFCVGALSAVRRKWLTPALIFAAVAGAGTALARDAWWDPGGVSVMESGMAKAGGYEGADEYAPRGCDRYDLPADTPRVIPLSDGRAPGKPAAGSAGKPRIHILRWAPEWKVFTVDSAEPITLALRLVKYPAWEAEVNGGWAPIRARPGTAQMLVPVPAGHSSVQVRFTRTLDRTIGAALSVLASAILAGFSLIGRGS